MRSQLSYPILSVLAIVLGLFTPGCEQSDTIFQELPLSALIILDFSDPNVLHDGTGGYRYHYEGQSYPATHKAWLNYSCPASPRFFAAYNDVDQTLWIAHCVEGIFLETVNLTTTGAGTNPATFLSEITGGQEETFEFQIPPSTLIDIENGTTQITVTFAYQND